MKTFIIFFLVTLINVSQAANIAYIYGDVAADGTIPSGSAEPYDQMLLTDMGDTGLSKFKLMVEAEGHSISQHYDDVTSLNAAFLANYEVVVFGLHQKQWSLAEKNALNAWLETGGGMLIYSDSASGGRYNIVGAQNTVGQMTTNNLIAQYGLQVTVDQANGVKQTLGVSSIPDLDLTGLILEGEGVSPVAVSDDPNANVLIPFTETITHDQNITITNPSYAALALRTVDEGHIVVLFDRQPMWNNGPGSDIEEEDNEEILRRLINFLALTPQIEEPPVEPPSPSNDTFHLVAPILLLLD